MDAVSYSHADKQKQRIEKIIAQPDSTSGLVSLPSTIASGETITIPSGRTVVHPNLAVSGTLNVQGTLFVPAGGSVTQSLVDATVVKQNGSAVANDSTVVHKTGDEAVAGVKTFTDGLKLQGQNVTPFSGFKNYIINGNFDVNQYSRLPLTSTMSYGVCIDNWRYTNTGTGTLTMSMDTIMYGGVTYKSLKATATTVLQDSSTIYGFYTNIEDKNCYHLVNKPFTVSFLCEVSHAGNYSLNIRKVTDSSSIIDVSYVKLIPLVVGVNRVEVSVPANASYISPNSANGRGLNICFGINGGSSATNTDEGWVAGNLAGHANTFKWWAIAGAYMKIAQVQLEEGSVATPFEQRPYGLELSLCQRYLPSHSGGAHGFTATTSTGSATIMFKTQARVPPTGVMPVGSIGNFSYTTQSVQAALTSMSLSTGVQTTSVDSAVVQCSVAGTPFTQNAVLGVPGILFGGTDRLLFTGCEL